MNHRYFQTTNARLRVLLYEVVVGKVLEILPSIYLKRRYVLQNVIVYLLRHIISNLLIPIILTKMCLLVCLPSKQINKLFLNKEIDQ